MKDLFEDFKVPGFFRRKVIEWRIRRLDMIAEQRLACMKRVSDLLKEAITDRTTDYTPKIIAYCEMIRRYERKLMGAGYVF